MNKKFISNNLWQTIASRNLGNHSDEIFKLVQIVKTYQNNYLFEVRETYKGSRTDAGFTLFLPEYKWLKEVLISNDSSIHTLEHNSRKITVNKSIPEYLISVQKSSGKSKQAVFNPIELSNLKKFFNENEERLNGLLNCNGLTTNFSEKSFWRTTIN